MASCLFNFTIQHIEGKKNIIADALSRCGLEKYNTISESSLKNPNHNLPPTKPSIPIITNSNFLQLPTTPLHTKIPARFHNIARPSTAPYWQTVNYDYWNQDPVEEDSGIITTVAVTTRAQAQQEERLVKSKTQKPNKINQVPRNLEENGGNFIDEDWTEEPMGEWTTIDNPENTTNSHLEDWEDWTVTNPPEDMENTIRRSPPPRENKWTPTLKGTLRIRGNDPRKCKDEVLEELKFYHSPPPPPSPTTSSPSNKAFCWNCKMNGYTMNEC